MGCLRAEGLWRHLRTLKLQQAGPDGDVVHSAVVAAPYAALVFDSVDHYGNEASTVQVFDLRTGAQRPGLGGESQSCDEQFPCRLTGVDQLVLGSDGVSAARVGSVDGPGFGSNFGANFALRVGGVTCAPSGPPCLVGGSGHFPEEFASGDPTGGAAAWAATPDLGGALGDPSCPSASLCVAKGHTLVYTTSDPVAGTWTTGAGRPPPFGFGFSVACPSTVMCVSPGFSDGSISVAASTNPAGGLDTWRVTKLKGVPYVDTPTTLCWSSSGCSISDGPELVLTSRDPAGGASAWTVNRTTPAFTTGSCPTPTLCVALADNPARILTTTNPESGPWTQTPIPDNLVSVSCPSTTLCAAVGDKGALYTSTNPTAGAWTKTAIDNGRRLTSIACPSASLCVATDDAGYVITSKEPTGSSAPWTPARLDPCNETRSCSDEEMQASDGNGSHIIDGARFPGTGQFLTDLKLTGDTLSWKHAGTLRTAKLTP